MALLLAVTAANASAFYEGFETIGGATPEGYPGGLSLEQAGWALSNQSDGLGTTDWFQGDPNTFSAQAGSNSSYIAANANAVADRGTISLWLLTPTQTLNNGDTFSFWTRTLSPQFYADRLQVRLSTNGASADTGIGPEGVGAFSTLLLDINPTLDPAQYPGDWTNYSLTLSGLSASTTGRLAFRYYVPDGGPNGTNSDMIGIDSVSFQPVPEPSVLIGLGAALLGLSRRRR